MKKIAVSVFVILLLVMISSICGAFTMSEKVVVASDQITVLRVSAGGMTPDQRIDRVNERLVEIISYEKLNADNIYLKDAGNSKILMVGSKTLITITPADAEANKMTVNELSQIWLNNAKSAIPQSRPKQ
jgi:uncharacterized membrane protein